MPITNQQLQAALAQFHQAVETLPPRVTTRPFSEAAAQLLALVVQKLTEG